MPILFRRTEASEETCQHKAQAADHRSSSLWAVLPRSFRQVEKTETEQVWWQEKRWMHKVKLSLYNIDDYKISY